MNPNHGLTPGAWVFVLVIGLVLALPTLLVAVCVVGALFDVLAR